MKQRIKDAIIVWLGGVTNEEHIDVLLLSIKTAYKLAHAHQRLDRLQPNRDTKTGRFVKKEK